jgi:hypothetical protein
MTTSAHSERQASTHSSTDSKVGKAGNSLALCIAACKHQRLRVGCHQGPMHVQCLCCLHDSHTARLCPAAFLRPPLAAATGTLTTAEPYCSALRQRGCHDVAAGLCWLLRAACCPKAAIMADDLRAAGHCSAGLPPPRVVQKSQRGAVDYR